MIALLAVLAALSALTMWCCCVVAGERTGGWRSWSGAKERRTTMAEYIRREDALAVIRKYYPRSYAGTFVYRDIAELPAVCAAEAGEVEAWIYDDYGYARCACCGWEWDVPETVTPYCPNCGAHMEDDEEADNNDLD